jgi:single-stranded DNA-binding protein
MPRNNHVFVVGNITSDMYYDTFQLDGKDVPFLRMHLMVNGTDGAGPLSGLRIVVYDTLAELTYGYIQRGSRIAVIGYLQRRTHENQNVFEVVATDVQFIKNIDWERGDLVRQDLVRKGKLRPTHEDLDAGVKAAEEGGAAHDGQEK